MSGETKPACIYCDRPSRKRGMCNRHYLRWWKATPPEQRVPPTASERFWSKVEKTQGCWLWHGGGHESGHGVFTVDRKPVPASRFALEGALGYPPPEGTEVCHRCDNPPCVNPRHLYYGTRQQNMDDAWARGRMPVGSQRAAAKLREEQVVALRERYAGGADARELAAEYGIAVTTLRHIVLGLKWKHVPGPITRRRAAAAQGGS
jgi:hypothetical protein